MVTSVCTNVVWFQVGVTSAKSRFQSSQHWDIWQSEQPWYAHTYTKCTELHFIPNQLLLVCDIITRAGETQKRQVRVISVSVTHQNRWDLRKSNVWLKCLLWVFLCGFECVCVSVCVFAHLAAIVFRDKAAVFQMCSMVFGCMSFR